jgi:hypothetical protein
MGATSFERHITIPKKTSTEEAFSLARQNALHEHGHGGYTGTLAEKHGFKLLATVKSRENAEHLVTAFYNATSERSLTLLRPEAGYVIDDKWGPAGAIRYHQDAQHDGVVFFGYASC